MESLSDGFMNSFSVEIAESEQQKQEVYRIRYRVYCDEFKYESTASFPDGLEKDEFDQFSRHCLIRHLSSGRAAGCVRLVPALGSLELMPLPLEKHCAESFDTALIAKLSLDRNSVCEISRLAVDPAFRRRDGEFMTRFGEIEGLTFSAQEQRTFAVIAVALFMAAVVMTEKDQRTNVFAMMEPFLPRLMNRAGIQFQRVGKEIDFHGIRAPYFITTQSALLNMRSDYRSLYNWVRMAVFG